MISKLKSKTYPLVSRHWIHATLVEGKLKNSHDKFRCMFVENDNLMGYLLPRMYSEPPLILKKWRIWTPLLKKVIDSHWKSVDIFIAVFPSGYHAELEEIATFKSQKLIRSFIDTSGGLNEVKEHLRDNKRRFYNKMERNSTFSCRISKDIKDFGLFYNEMHLPHTQKQFQDLAYLDPYEDMTRVVSQGFLVDDRRGK